MGKPERLVSFVVSNVRLHRPHGRRARTERLLGYVSFTLNGLLHLDQIRLARTNDGTIVLLYPERRDRQKRMHAVVRPADRTVRREIEGQVLQALGLIGRFR